MSIKPNSVNFELQVSGPAHVFLNMLYAPGWQLTVNGVPEISYRANYLFQGFDVRAPGKYEFQLSYRPYAYMLLLSTPYLVLLFLMLWAIPRMLRKKKS